MAKTKEQKKEALESLKIGMKSSKATVFANFQGLKVSEMEELRSLCREQEVECVAGKKTLVTKALQDNGFDASAVDFDGGVAVFYGNTDEVTPAQIVANFAKKHDVVKIFGGILENAFIDAKKVTELSALPSKQELLAKVVGSINAPISGFVNVLAGNMRGLVTVLSAIKDKKA